MMYINQDSAGSPLKCQLEDETARKTSVETVLPALKNLLRSPGYLKSPEPIKEHIEYAECCEKDFIDQARELEKGIKENEEKMRIIENQNDSMR